MLDMREIRERTEEVIENVRNRGLSLDIPALMAVDQEAREARTELERVRQRRNEISERMKGKLAPEERSPLVEEGRGLKERESELEERYKHAEERRREMQTQVPNFTHPK
ncbi:MAG: serine--tRNA ligase, partial [Deltaproteobacteria bacterium]|nr:serine--tRNA ligase [Deltaproteobacteria bacterium]